jgi:hypothetical protein
MASNAANLHNRDEKQHNNTPIYKYGTKKAKLGSPGESTICNFRCRSKARKSLKTRRIVFSEAKLRSAGGSITYKGAKKAKLNRALMIGDRRLRIGD